MAITNINIIANIVFSFLYLEIIKIISDLKVSVVRYFFGLVLLSSLTIACSLHNPNSLLKVVLIFSSLLIVGKIVFMDTSISKIFFSCMIYYACGAIADLVGYYMFTYLGMSMIDVHSNPTLLIISNANLCFVLTLGIIFSKYIKERYKGVNDFGFINIWNKYLLIAFVILYSNIYLIAMYNVNKTKVEGFIWLVPITFFIVVLFAAYSQFLARSKEHQNSQLQYYLTTMSKLSNDIKQFKHDFKNVLISLYGLAEKEEWDALHKRLLELQGSNITQYSSDIEAMVNIREQSLISLLAAKMFYANKHNINFFIEAPHIIDKMPIKGTDFIRIVGILIDNAIEAAQQCTKPEVGAIFLSYNDYFELIVVNCVESENLEIAAMDQRGFSTRGIGRGTGLSSLAAILENYQPVEWNTVVKNNKFMQCIGFKRK